MQNNKSYFQVIEVAGLRSAIRGMRCPTKSYDASDSFVGKNGRGNFVLGPKDANLATSLIRRGNEHAKFQRGIVAWMEINLPRYVWLELDTYSVGVLPVSSESTMYTLKKELRGAGCYNDFERMLEHGTDPIIIEAFADTIGRLIQAYETVDNIPQVTLKSAIPESFMQMRVRAFTYQTLHRIYAQRHEHRLRHWPDVICPAIAALPYASELIFGLKEGE